MGTKKTTKKNIKNIDWLSLAVIISTSLLAFVFISAQVANFVEETDRLEAQQDKTTQAVEFKYNSQNSDSTPEKVYEEMRQALLNNDIDTVLETLHPAYRHKYEDNLRAAHEDGNLSIFAERMTPLKEKIYDDGWSTVTYRTEPIPGNDQSDNPLEGYTEAIEFTRTSKGYWKISSI